MNCARVLDMVFMIFLMISGTRTRAYMHPRPLATSLARTHACITEKHALAKEREGGRAGGGRGRGGGGEK